MSAKPGQPPVGPVAAMTVYPPSVVVPAIAGERGNNNNNNVAGESAPKTQYNADGTKKIPKGVEELRDGLVKGLQKVDPKTEALSCVTAVENVRYQLDLMIEVGQRNTKDGYITQAEFDATAAKLRQSKSSSVP